MYSTVINSHSTTIRHATPQPTGVSVHPTAAAAFSVDSEQTLAMKQSIPNGAYSIPVQISASSDSNKDGYEAPSFIHKKEKKIEESEKNQNNSGSETQFDSLDPAVFLKSSMEKDIGEFTAQFDNTNDKNDRITTCKYL
jgi:hypothetical protein